MAPRLSIFFDTQKFKESDDPSFYLTVLNHIMRAIAFALSLAAAAFAQSVTILDPTEGETFTPGQEINVGVVRFVSTTDRLQLIPVIYSLLVFSRMSS